MVQVSYYEILSVPRDAEDAQIRTAYRRRSLAVHPDRNRDDPRAAELFNELRIAYDVLLDPAQRRQHDQEIASAENIDARFAEASAKRKAMYDDLVRREEEARQATAPHFLSPGEIAARVAALQKETHAMRMRKAAKIVRGVSH